MWKQAQWGGENHSSYRSWCEIEMGSGSKHKWLSSFIKCLWSPYMPRTALGLRAEMRHQTWCPCGVRSLWQTAFQCLRSGPKKWGGKGDFLVLHFWKNWPALCISQNPLAHVGCKAVSILPLWILAPLPVHCFRRGFAGLIDHFTAAFMAARCLLGLFHHLPLGGPENSGHFFCMKTGDKCGTSRSICRPSVMSWVRRGHLSDYRWMKKTIWLGDTKISLEVILNWVQVLTPLLTSFKLLNVPWP